MFLSIRLLAPKQKQMGYKVGRLHGKKKSLKKENIGVFLEYYNNFLQRNLCQRNIFMRYSKRGVNKLPKKRFL